MTEINPFKLPVLPLANRGELPESSGVYFAIKRKKVLYIGSARNLRKRWARGHDRVPLFEHIGHVCIAYLSVAEGEALKLEAEYIRRFQPRFNRTNAGGSRVFRPLPRPVPRPVTISLKIRSIAEIYGFDSEQLANAAGIPRTSMRRIWSGNAQNVSLDILSRLCAILGVHPGLLFERRLIAAETEGSAAPLGGAV